MIKKPMFRRFPAACALFFVGTFNLHATPELEERVALLEQQLIQAQAESVAFGQRNLELVDENARLRECFVSDGAKERFALALANVVEHSAEMREQLGASQQRIEGLAIQLQEAMRIHQETQERLESKQRSLFAHATTLQRQLEALPTPIEFETDSYYEDGWSGEEAEVTIAEAETTEDFPVPGEVEVEPATDEELPVEIASVEELPEVTEVEPLAEPGAEVEPATTDEPEPFFDANATFEEETKPWFSEDDAGDVVGSEVISEEEANFFDPEEAEAFPEDEVAVEAVEPELTTGEDAEENTASGEATELKFDLGGDATESEFPITEAPQPFETESIFDTIPAVESEVAEEISEPLIESQDEVEFFFEGETQTVEPLVIEPLAVETMIFDFIYSRTQELLK